MTGNAKSTVSNSELRKALNQVLAQRVCAAEEARRNLVELLYGDTPLNNESLANMDKGARDSVRSWIHDWQAGQEAKQMLFANNRPLVRLLVNKRPAEQLTRAELTEAGNTGLLKAIESIGEDKYDSQKGDFGAYASKIINNELTSAVDEVWFADQYGHADPLREYRKAEEKWGNAVAAASPAFANGQSLAVDERWRYTHSKGELSYIANEMGKSSDEARILQQHSREPATLNQALKGSESTSTLEDIAPDNSTNVIDASSVDAYSSLEQILVWLRDETEYGDSSIQLLNDLLNKRSRRGLRSKPIGLEDRPEYLFLNDEEFAEIVKEYDEEYFMDEEEVKDMLAEALGLLRRKLEEEGFTKESLFDTRKPKGRGLTREG